MSSSMICISFRAFIFHVFVVDVGTCYDPYLLPNLFILGQLSCHFCTELLRGFAGSFCDVSSVVSGGFDVADTLVKKKR